MMAAVACAAVPKITVVIGGCYGSDSYVMVRVAKMLMGLVIDFLRFTKISQHFIFKTVSCCYRHLTQLIILITVKVRNALGN